MSPRWLGLASGKQAGIAGRRMPKEVAGVAIGDNAPDDCDPDYAAPVNAWHVGARDDEQ